MGMTTLQDPVTNHGLLLRHSGDMHLLALFRWCQEVLQMTTRTSHRRRFYHHHSFEVNHSMDSIQEHVADMLQQRQLRWLALRSVFPPVHWMTLTFLASAIAIAFLVATDQQDFIFQSLQVRILWAVLMGSFSALAVLCYDLSSPFGGAYQVSY